MHTLSGDIFLLNSCSSGMERSGIDGAASQNEEKALSVPIREWLVTKLL